MNGIVRRILGASVGLIVFGCATETAPSPVHEQLDAGFPYRPAPEPAYSELPEPFIRLVDLARLRIGMTKAEVLAIFPDPQTINVSPRGLEVWEYGFAQLHFRNGLLANWFDLTRPR